MDQLLEDFIKARKVGVPLIAIETQDQFGTATALKKCAVAQVEIDNKEIRKKNEKVKDGEEIEAEEKIPPIIFWDIVSGWRPANPEGQEAIRIALGDKKPNMLTNPAEMLNYALKLPNGSILFLLNMHRFIGSENSSQAAVGQGLANIRNEYKDSERTAILLCPGIKLPEELKQDILVLDEPLPKTTELREIVTKLYTSNEKLKTRLPAIPILDKAQEILRGLSRFSAEQTTALSITDDGSLDLNRLWVSKRTAIQAVPGLSVWKGSETYVDVEGVTQAKEFLTAVCTGEDRPTVIVFADEIEKALAGTQGDLSGTSQEMHGQLLSYMSDEEVLAMMMVGHPGCTKSFLAKATGGEFGMPVVLFNVSSLKGSLVGQSTQQMRAALKMISAIGKPLFLATCNDLKSLSPELKSRFELGVFFFDLPSPAEQRKVWELYIKKFKLASKMPAAQDVEWWTPREIRACCNIAWRLKMPLEKAAKYIVPITRSAPERITELRKEADNRYLSASHPGVYIFGQEELTESKMRKINIAGVGEA